MGGMEVGWGGDDGAAAVATATGGVSEGAAGALIDFDLPLLAVGLFAVPFASGVPEGWSAEAVPIAGDD